VSLACARSMCALLRAPLARIVTRSGASRGVCRANISAYTVSAEPVTSAVFPGRVEPGVKLGSYEVLLCVARGGMACVWAARDESERRQSRVLALKTVLPELAEPEFESMFREEARVAARIVHPNVCEVYELVEQSGVLALAMEWVDGDTLNALLGNREHLALDARVAAFIVAQAACGLHAAHELRDDTGAPMQLVHRDVSPQNILLSRDGGVKVADFGVAKGLGSSREQTEAGRIKGKLSYMSPEQAEGKPLDRRSDIYALGIVLYVATVGVHPFRAPGDSRDDQLLRLLVGQFEPPSKRVADYPAELEAIVLRAMAREPEDRFATADELRTHLQAWIGKSEPSVGSAQVARVLAERMGKALELRAERIQRCLVASHQLRGIDSLPGGIAELTFTPTSRGVSNTFYSLTAAPARHAMRGILTAVAAALLGIIGTLTFTGGEKAQPQHTSEALASSPAAAVQAKTDSAPSTTSSQPHAEPSAPRAEVPRAASPPERNERRELGTVVTGEDSGLSGMAAARRRAQTRGKLEERPSTERAGHPSRLDESAQRSIGSALNGAASRRRSTVDGSEPPRSQH
jgi:eukaryotic-like serine/threonine-protein kinase